MADPAAGGGAAGRRGSGGTASAADGWPVAGGAGWGGIGGKQRKARMRRRKTDRVGGKRHEVDEGRWVARLPSRATGRPLLCPSTRI
jgi:hypothetical protein